MGFLIILLEMTLLEAPKVQAQTSIQILTNQLTLQVVKLLWANQPQSGQRRWASGRAHCFLPFSTSVSGQQPEAGAN